MQPKRPNMRKRRLKTRLLFALNELDIGQYSDFCTDDERLDFYVSTVQNVWVRQDFGDAICDAYAQDVRVYRTRTRVDEMVCFTSRDKLAALVAIA